MKTLKDQKYFHSVQKKVISKNGIKQSGGEGLVQATGVLQYQDAKL